MNSILNKRQAKSLIKYQWKNWLKINKNRFNIHKRVELDKSVSKDLENLISECDYTAIRAVNVFKPVISAIGHNYDPDEFLNEVYDYILEKSFPHAVSGIYKLENRRYYTLFLEFLGWICNIEKRVNCDTFMSKYPMDLLDSEEEENLVHKAEYIKFKKAFVNKHIYELMKINKDITGFNSIEHICGVYYISMNMARKIKKAGIPIDLGVISGAAACHDVGKFGCSGDDAFRVPYLHYYYTDIWFKDIDAPFIGNIAVNHSTWDLELENLSIESLVLIYADFRVKNKKNDGIRFMNIFDLDESFSVILNMLDNVDEKKELRYRHVYNKLKDFENFLISRGVSPNIHTDELIEVVQKPKELMYGDEITENIKNKAVYYNIRIMEKLSGYETYNTELEIAANKEDWRDLRGYLTIYEGYSSYFTITQKLSLLGFLYDMLSHKEDDIRKNSAELMGRIIGSIFDKYRKEVPQRIDMREPEVTSKKLLQRYGHMIIFPDHKMIEAHRIWVQSSFYSFLKSLLQFSTEEQHRDYILVLKEIFDSVDVNDRNTCIYALEASKALHYESFCDECTFILDFIEKCLKTEIVDIKIATLSVLGHIMGRLDSEHEVFCKFKEKILSFHFLDNEAKTVSYFYKKLRKSIDSSGHCNLSFNEPFALDLSIDEVNEIFLDDLKAATSWIEKIANISILKDISLKSNHALTYETVMHFCNLLKVSETENVRNKAGQSIVDIFPVMDMHQRNEVCVELVRALDIQEYQFSKFIPPYLGQLLLFLKPDELKESLDRMSLRSKTGTYQTTFLVLSTVGISMEYIKDYKDRFELTDKEYEDLLDNFLGILLSGLYNYNDHIKHEAFRIICQNIFGSKLTSLEQKISIFNSINKKINNSLTETENSQYIFFNDAASLNHIYRFISEYEFEYKDSDCFAGFCTKRNIAFFPGTFDPFSLGHKEIAKKIRDLGFDVYLSVDEFSWSKRTQPNKLRRKIIEMSIADEFNIYTFPEQIQVNLTNNENLRQLEDIFSDSNLYMVVGSDVILNASCYKSSAVDKEINRMNHIVFKRLLVQGEDCSENMLLNMLKGIDGDVKLLTLPPQYEEISSSQIREYVDENKDISNIIDPLVQKFIYEFGIYRREPQYKDITNTNTISLRIEEYPTEELLSELCIKFFNGDSIQTERIYELSRKHKLKIAYIRHIEKDEIMAFSVFFRLESYSFFKIFEDECVNSSVRNNSIGNIALLAGIYTEDNSKINNLEQIVLTETLAHCLKKDYTYAVFKDMITCELPNKNISTVLENQGFVMINGQIPSKNIYAVNMASPCIINLDLERMLKDPFKSNEKIIKVIEKARKKLQRALTNLYPGNLVLAFDIKILNEKLVEKICKINKVKSVESKPRKLGKNMCVPFGSALERTVVPNTVTKFLHTEKVFDDELDHFDIETYPHYLSLSNQVKMIKAFDRPVILSDDLLHKGYRISAIDKIFKQEDVPVLMLIFGIMSGRGKELMDIQERNVDSVYFIPNLRIWFNERNLYPYIGGDSIVSEANQSSNILNSINFILPYASPGFIRDVDTKSIYELSKICIENSIDIHTAIEEEYRIIYERNFTLREMGNVFTEPRSGSFRSDIIHSLDSKPSDHLIKDLESLKRLRNIIFR